MPTTIIESQCISTYLKENIQKKLFNLKSLTTDKALWQPTHVHNMKRLQGNLFRRQVYLNVVNTQQFYPFMQDLFQQLLLQIVYTTLTKSPITFILSQKLEI